MTASFVVVLLVWWSDRGGASSFDDRFWCSWWFQLTFCLHVAPVGSINHRSAWEAKPRAGKHMQTFLAAAHEKDFLFSCAKWRCKWKQVFGFTDECFSVFSPILCILASGRSEDTFRHLRDKCRIFPGTSEGWSDGAEHRKVFPSFRQL